MNETQNLNNESYLYIVYEFLTIQYFKGHDNLGGFLGSLSPEIFMGKGPADAALLEDWRKVAGNKENIDIQLGYQYMIKFLKFEQSLGWDGIEEILELLNNPESTEIWQEWLQAIERSKKYF